jgi:hypothetical protein
VTRLVPPKPRTRAVVDGLVAVAIVAAVGIALARHGNTRTIGPPAATRITQNVDFQLLPTLAALVNSADLICACTVLSEGPLVAATPRVDGGGAPSALPPTAQQDFQVRVDQMLHAVGAAPGTLTVTQLRPRTDPRAAPDSPPLVAGSRYVLFLKRAANGNYGLVSGPQGMLLVDAQNRLQPALSGDPVTDLLRNHTLAELAALLPAPPTPAR